MENQQQQENNKIRVNARPGEMPPFWDRNIVFFANLLSIFYGNNGKTEMLKQEVGGLETYGGRLIPILNLLFRGGGENLLVLEAPPDKVLLDHYTRTLGLQVPKLEILSHTSYKTLCEKRTEKDETKQVIERIKNHPANWIDGFVTDATLVDIANFLGKKTTSTPDGSRFGNNKLLLHLNLAEKGFPVFDTVTAESHEEVSCCLEELRCRGFSKAVIKSQVGASGIGMVKVSTEIEKNIEIPDYFFLDGECLVQGWLDESVKDVQCTGSPSVQMFLDEDTVHLYDITEQILSGDSVHEGNISPPIYIASRDDIKDELLLQGAEAGKWLHRQGYRGTASADFLVIDREGKTQVFVCEINARVTGATYPSVLVRHFMPEGAWLMRNIRFNPSVPSKKIMELFEKAEVFYRPEKSDGIIPINFNEEEERIVHKGQLLCLGPNTEVCAKILEQVTNIIPTGFVYDRD